MKRRHTFAGWLAVVSAIVGPVVVPHVHAYLDAHAGAATIVAGLGVLAASIAALGPAKRRDVTSRRDRWDKPAAR